MTIVPLESSWSELIDLQWIEQLDQASFLVRCRKKIVTKNELFSFLKQHYYYSSNFIRYLCALISNIPETALNRMLIENLFEEMGLVGDGKPHFQIYNEMLDSLGVKKEGAINFATQRLIDQMFEYCRDPDPIYGLAALCLGAEAIVPHLYSQLVIGFKSVGIEDDQLKFFQIHVECDDQHAITMKKIIEKMIKNNCNCKITLRSVAKNMLMLRRDFFENISVSAKKEKKREAILL